MNISKVRKSLRTGALIMLSLSVFLFSFGSFQSLPMISADTTQDLNTLIKNGDVDASGYSNGGYQDLDITIKNRTRDDLSVDISKAYFLPPEGSSSQRLAISHIAGTDGDTIVRLDPKEEKTINAVVFCINSTSGSPMSGEDYTFAGDVSDLEDRPYLSDILDWFAENPDEYQSDVQAAIWSIESDYFDDYYDDDYYADYFDDQGNILPEYEEYFDNYHQTDEAKSILQEVIGVEDPFDVVDEIGQMNRDGEEYDLKNIKKAQEEEAKQAEIKEAKDEAMDKAGFALGMGLSALLASISISTLGGTGPLEGVKGFGGIVSDFLKPKQNPSKELIENLNVDNKTAAILGEGEKLVKNDPKLTKTYQHAMTGLNIFNDANTLHKSGYNDNILQSVGLSTMMNLAANTAMENIGESIVGLETIAKLIMPKSCQDILPSNIVKQSVQSLGDVTKAIATSLGAGNADAINEYAQGVKDGKSGLMLSGYAQIGETLGNVVSSIEETGVGETITSFANDVKQIIEQGTWKNVIVDGANKIADEANAGNSADKGIAEIASTAGHVIGTLESKGVVEGTKEIATTLKDDVSLIIKHGDAGEIIEGVSKSAEKATGIIGTGVKEASSLVGEYYEKGGGVVGGVKGFAKDVKLIWKYLW